MQAALRFEHVTKRYELDGGGSTIALLDIDLHVNREEIFCLVGPSGCGKSTLLNLAAGFVPVTTGQVIVEGEPVTHAHSRCGFSFQADAVFPWMTVAANVGYGLRWNGTAPDRRGDIVGTYLNRVGLAGFAERWPRELSGGMRKRVDLARAFAFDPPILLLDEPFGSLDALTKEEMQELLLEIWRTDRKTVLFVTHDVEEAVFLGERVGVMSPRPGRIHEVFAVPFGLDERTVAMKVSPEFVAIRRAVLAALAKARGASESSAEASSHGHSS